MAARKTQRHIPIRRHLIVAGILAILGFMLVKAVQATLIRARVEKEISGLEAELEKIQQQSGALRATVEELGTSEALEQEARKRLNVSKEGEKTIVLVPQGEQHRSSEEQDSAAVPEQKKENEEKGEPSNLSKWWRKFFGP